MPVQGDDPIIDEIWERAKLEERATFIISSVLAIVLYLFEFSFWWFPSIMLMLNSLVYFERRVHQSLVFIEKQLDEIYGKK